MVVLVLKVVFMVFFGVVCGVVMRGLGCVVVRWYYGLGLGVVCGGVGI